MVGRWMLLLAAAGFVLGAMAGCRFERRKPLHPERPNGSWYVVNQGETLADIAARTGVPAEDLLELNGLERADQVTPGKLIYVLDARTLAPGAVTPAGRPEAAPLPASTAAAPSEKAGRLRWPLDKPQVGSYFGARSGRRHEGIDLPAPMGTPVYAAGPGRVVYAGNGIRGYGNLVVLQHAGDLLTVYAHNATLLVKQGDEVAAGQKVALVGQSGRATGPHLHFEVREGQIPRDPLRYLGASATGGAP